MAFQAPDDTLTYERYFGLVEKPFSLNADPRFVYNSPGYAATCAELIAGIRRRDGLLVLTGEVGTGKTTLCRAVLRELGRKTYASFMPDPFASREDLLKMLLIDFGVLSIQELITGPLRGASRTELGCLLSHFLDSLKPETFVVVIIDEAQNLSLPLIEETRILADTFGVKGKLQLVIVGQPELQAKLKLPEMRQVDQRVCGYHRLGPLSRDAVTGYVQHRLLAAGGHRDRILFPPEVVETLYQRSGGVPRLINRVCDRALRLAHERQARAVDRATLEAALTEIGSTTLLPVGDSLVVAESSPHRVTPAETTLEPKAASVKPDVESAPPTVHRDEFWAELADWAERDLRAPSHAPSLQSSEEAALSHQPPERNTASSDEVAQSHQPPARKPASSGQSKFAVKTDWPREVRSKTYTLRRVLGGLLAIAAATVVALKVATLGGSYLAGLVTAPPLPTLPEAPVFEVPAIALPEAPRADAPVSEVSAPTAVTGEHLVAVGLFESAERAEQLVEALTEAGLPALQRPLQFRQQQMQQILLGPYLSRTDAVADLRRLQALGGHDDARVIEP